MKAHHRKFISVLIWVLFSLSNDNKLSQDSKESGCLQYKSNAGYYLAFASNCWFASTPNVPSHHNSAVSKFVRLVHKGQKPRQYNLTTLNMHIL